MSHPFLIIAIIMSALIGLGTLAYGWDRLTTKDKRRNAKKSEPEQRLRLAKVQVDRIVERARTENLPFTVLFTDLPTTMESTLGEFCDCLEEELKQREQGIWAFCVPYNETGMPYAMIEKWFFD